jgi:hypothetical protein
MLLQYPHIRHHHPAVGRLAHVVDRQQTDLHRGKRFHFDPGLADRLHLRAAVHTGGRGIDLEIDRDPGNRQRMAQRHQVAGALGAHDGGDARDAQHVAFFASVSGFMRIVPAATATRCVSVFAPTSTIWAWPVSSKWVSGLAPAVGLESVIVV